MNSPTTGAFLVGGIATGCSQFVGAGMLLVLMISCADQGHAWHALMFAAGMLAFAASGGWIISLEIKRVRP